MNTILINCDSKLNKTIAIVNDGVLVEKYYESFDSNRLEGNIYLGKVVDLLPGMQAAFVDIGQGQNSFLHIKDIMPKASNETGNKNEEYENYNIKDYIRVGMPIIVQVKKDKTEKKGARVSTHLNIGGRFVALMPNLNFITVSQKIEDTIESNRLKDIIKKANTYNHGIILRTSANDKAEEEIIEDLAKVLNLYNKIEKISEELLSNPVSKPQVILENGGIVKKLLIDLIDNDIQKIITNNVNIYNDVNDILDNMQIMQNKQLVELYKSDNILELYNVNRQLEQAQNRKIWLKCGGFIAIDKTEALTAIDVNTGKFTGKSNLEETVLKVNQEATKEIAKQLRLKDVGGIIIIDYIDMEKKSSEKEIEKLLIEELKKDRAKTQVLGFTPLHLLEMTRKHIFSADN